MIELLSLCGYETRKIESELPRVRKVFDKLAITENDIKIGKQRLRTYYDMELKGVRKLLGCYLRELVTIVLAREEGKRKIIHGCMAPGFDIIGGAIRSYSSDVFVMIPSPSFTVVLGCIFGKFVPVLEAAEKLWLKAGVVAHCAMVKSRLGLLSLGFVPKPDFLVTTGSTCETSPKTNDLLKELYGIPALCYDTCRDIDPRDYPDQTRAINFAAEGMRRVTRMLEEGTGFEIRNDMLWEVFHAKGVFGDAQRKVQALVHKSDPVPMASTHGNLLSWLGAAALSIDNLRKATDAFNILHEELQERVSRGIGILEKGAPRILGILPFHHSDPRLEHLINELGMAQIASDYEFPVLFNAPGLETTKDPFVAVAQGSLRSPIAYHLAGRVAIVRDACKKLNIDGVLNHYHVGCRGVAADAMIIHNVILNEFNIPVLWLEWENFDPRVFDYEHFSTHLKIFKSMMENRKR